MEISKLQKFLNNLTNETVIDKDNAILLGYDLNKDSIFSVAEIENLKKDIEKANLSDNDPTKLSTKDLESFYNSTKKNTTVQPTQENIKEFEYWVELVAAGNTSRYTEMKKDEHYQKLSPEKQEFAKEFLKLENTNPKLETYELINIADITTDKNLSRIKELLTTKINDKYLPSYSIEELIENDIEKQNKAIQILKENNLDTNRILGTIKITDVYKYFPKDILKENPNFYIVSNADGAVGYKLDKNAKEEFLYKPQKGLVETRTQNSELNETTIHNSEKNIIQTVRTVKINNEEGLVTEEKIIKLDNLAFDKNNNTWTEGNTIETRTMSPSDIDGVPNIIVKNANGTEKILQQGKILDDGTISVTKDFTSPDGTTTNVDYTETPDGITTMKYKIQTKTGEVLLDKNQTIKQISENEYKTTINDKEYKVTFQKDKLIINDGKNTKTFDISKRFITEGKAFVHELLERTPANLLMAMDKIPINAINFDLDNSTTGLKDNGRWSENEQVIEIGFPEEAKIDIKKKDTEKVAKELLATFMHEYGHYLDSNGSTGSCEEISSNEELLKIFNEEKQAFLKATTGQQQDYLNYFLDKTDDKRKAQERVGEATMLLNTIPTKTFATRASYFQENLPRTIAKINELINARINND